MGDFASGENTVFWTTLARFINHRQCLSGEWHAVFTAAFHPRGRNSPDVVCQINFIPPPAENFSGTRQL